MKKLLLTAALIVGIGLTGGEIPIKSGETIAFLGDSITNFGNRPDGYVHLVMDGLRRAGIEAKMIPAGINGQNSAEMLKRLPALLAKKPEWLLLQCGTNDCGPAPKGMSVEEYGKNVSAILEQAQAAKVRVMLVTPSMRREDPKGSENQKLDQMCQFVRQSAAKASCLLADWNQAEHELIAARGHVIGNKVTIDGVHLNGYGNCVLAATILRAFGMSADKVAECQEAWNKIPTMSPIINAWYAPKYMLSISDYEVIEREAVKANLSVEKMVQKIIGVFRTICGINLC